MSVKSDLLAGAQATKDLSGWREVTHTFVVTGVEGDGYEIYAAALSAAGIPSLANGGSAHPDLALLYADDMTMAFKGRDASGKAIVHITVVYRRKTLQKQELPVQGEGGSPERVITVGTTLEQTQSNVDYEGKPLLVAPTQTGEAYNAGTTYGRLQVVSLGGKYYQSLIDSNTGNGPGTAAANGKWRLYSQTGVVSVGMPKTSLRFSRVESGSPADKSMTYVGCTNSGAWGSLATDQQARVWRCDAITGTSNDLGATFRVDYDFLRCEQKRDGGQVVDTTWDAFVYWIDPETGKPPSDVADIDYAQQAGQGWRRYQVYPTVDFAGLNLT